MLFLRWGFHSAQCSELVVETSVSLVHLHFTQIVKMSAGHWGKERMKLSEVFKVLPFTGHTDKNKDNYIVNTDEGVRAWMLGRVKMDSKWANVPRGNDQNRISSVVPVAKNGREKTSISSWTAWRVVGTQGRVLQSVSQRLNGALRPQTIISSSGSTLQAD